MKNVSLSLVVQHITAAAPKERLQSSYEDEKNAGKIYSTEKSIICTKASKQNGYGSKGLFHILMESNALTFVKCLAKQFTLAKKNYVVSS